MRDVPMTEQQSPWRWYPLGLVAAMLVVFAVNGGMIWAAMTTFPGAAGEDGFDLSNGYTKVLAESARQASLGWKVTAGLDPARHPVLRPSDRDGNVLHRVAVKAQAVRPVGPEAATALSFLSTGDGSFVANETLERGQWVVTIDLERDGQRMSVTERLVVR